MKVLKVVGGVVVAIAAILAIGVGISAVVGDRPASLKHVGVAKVNGGLVVYACDDDGIGSVEIQRGASVDGPLVWGAERVVASGSLKMLPIATDPPGYSTRGPGLAGVSLDQSFALRRLTDTRGVNLLRSYIVFRPGALAEGSIVDQKGSTQSLSSWLATTSGC
jgi:hypothetical protein